MPDRVPWFRPKRVGWGWTPQTWQGWVVSFVPVIIVLVIVLLVSPGH